MNLNSTIKKIQDIMRQDEGINGDAQIIEQLVWILFLKICQSDIIPLKYKWENWAVDKKRSKSFAGDNLINFVNNELFTSLKTAKNKNSSEFDVSQVFLGTNNYMKNGVLLRKVINIIDDIDFTLFENRHAFGELYENLLKDLQSAGNSGEFYTPRGLTDFMVSIVNPQISENIADFACGTGGFLTSSLKFLQNKAKNNEEFENCKNSLYGIEKKSLPFLLCSTNLILNKIENPKIFHKNSLALDNNLSDFDVILMNPPFGSSETEEIREFFDENLKNSDTSDLFMEVIMKKLAKNGRCGVILPDAFLSGNDCSKLFLKKNLVENFNLHTIIRLPSTVFAPYTNISTNILFFDNTIPTSDIWFYRFDMPAGYKNFSKTKPILSKHFEQLEIWWNNRKEIEIYGSFKAKKLHISQIENYNFDHCGFVKEETLILPPQELIANFKRERDTLNAEINNILTEINDILASEDI